MKIEIDFRFKCKISPSKKTREKRLSKEKRPWWKQLLPGIIIRVIERVFDAMVRFLLGL